jgi:hypothetical protein
MKMVMNTRSFLDFAEEITTKEPMAKERKTPGLESHNNSKPKEKFFSKASNTLSLALEAEKVMSETIEKMVQESYQLLGGSFHVDIQA